MGARSSSLENLEDSAFVDAVRNEREGAGAKGCRDNREKDAAARYTLALASLEIMISCFKFYILRT